MLILIWILINLFVSNKNEVSVSRGASKSRNASSRGQACSDLDEEDDESTEDDETDSNDCLSTTRSSHVSASGSLVNTESLFDLMMSSKSRDAYFWQYNVQSKGPKTKKVR